MIELIRESVQWVGLHPHFAGAIIAAVACLESLAFVGLVVPGAAVMLGAGALIGAGALDFWTTFAWALGGAVAGDGVSYWLGHRYQDRIRRWPALARRPQILERGEGFFRSHGGKSVLLARFVGPVRPIVPVVAGMLGMKPVRFYTYNILSALAWAPAHLLPGMAFGASLALAGQVAVRLALLLGALIVAAWLIFGMFHLGYRLFSPAASKWTRIAMGWGHGNRVVRWFVGDLLDPSQPVSRVLLVWFVVLIGGSWLFFGVLQDMVAWDPIVYVGQSLYHILQQLRTPLGDRVMVAVTELGDATVTIPLATVVFVVLVVRGARRDALYWAAAIGFGALVVATIKIGIKIPRPLDLYNGFASYSFPSGHASMSTVVYGFLAVLAAPALGRSWRWLAYAAAGLLISAIAFSRLYLGAHWLPDVIAGVALGSVWVAILAIGRRRRQAREQPIPGLIALSLTAFLTVGSWHIYTALPEDFFDYAPSQPMQRMAARTWWEGGWWALPAYRFDLGGEHEQPLDIQWAGELQEIRSRLQPHGWRNPPELTYRSALKWLLPTPSLATLPIVPQIHNGQYESLLLVYPGSKIKHPDEELILRLWPSGYNLGPGSKPLWIGNVGWYRIRKLPLIRIPKHTDEFDDALKTFRTMLRREPIRSKTVLKVVPVSEYENLWKGEILLLTDMKPVANIQLPQTRDGISGRQHCPYVEGIVRRRSILQDLTVPSC